MTRRLPLFPLGTVLFPGLVLPLNVFEPRYRALVEDLVAAGGEEPRGFGVVAIRAGHEVGADNVHAMHDVGCVAQLREVTELDDGRYEIVTVGTSRFRVTGIDDAAGTPYLTALVEPYGQDPALEEDAAADPAAEVLAASVRERFARYRENLDIGGTEAPEDPSVLSYLVAAAMVLETRDRQRLLEEPDTRSRLRSELDLLKRELLLVEALGAVPATELPAFPATFN
ncbi:LON peptidase substrate-binding domain-containing protein [Kineococcus glutinatus]|uniref:LON peptidase substrate-binding domain-containing protein n=1 Tax=Kineococcus glutinatus TaxID=1070872 RepID=A0ABP9I504_9ACTN